MVKFNKTNIIVLALLYNYLSKKEDKITKNDFAAFFNELNHELFLNKYSLINTEENEQILYQIEDNIIKLPDTTPYSLLNLKCKYIDNLPKEVIEASLSTNVLRTLQINRNKINTRKCYEPRYLMGATQKVSEEVSKKYKKMKVLSHPIYKNSIVYSIERQVIDIDFLIDEYENKQK